MGWLKGAGAALAVCALSMVGAAQTHDDQGIQYEDEIVFVRHAFGQTDHQGPGQPQTFTCGSDDAQTTLPTMAQHCTTGQHQADLVSITIGFHLLQPGLTGTVDNIVLSDRGEARLRCSWVDGNVTACDGVHTGWPHPGEPFCHGLWAYETPVLPAAPIPDLDDCEALLDGAPTSPAPAGLGPAEGPWSGYLAYATR